MNADTKYINQRNRLIPLAEAYADRAAGKRPKGNSEAWLNRWNLMFHSRMDALAREQGLC